MFRRIQALFPHRRTDEKGASAVEYGLLIALIAAIIVVAVIALGGAVKSAFEDTEKCITGEVSAACPAAEEE